MPVPEPADMRERILAEATLLFVSRGYHGISMREIAEQVGLSKAALYYHFQDKEALFLAILGANLESMDRLVQAAQERRTAREQIGWLMRAIFEQPPAQRAIIRLASQEMGQLSQAARADFARRYREKFTDRLADLLRAAIDRGELRAMDVRQATWILLGMMYPFFYPAHERAMGRPNEAIALMLAIFFDGAGRR